MQVKKSEKASLEKDKLVYTLMGLVFVLSLVYVALEWTEHEVTKYTPPTDVFDLIEDDMDIQQTSQETPPPPPPPAVQEVEVLNVVEDNVETESIEVNTEETEQEVVIAAPVEAPVLFKYLSENVKYPVIAQENGIQGRVICQFVVNRDGSIVDVEVVRSGGDPSLDKEAVRVIKSMPKWKPGQQRGKPVRVKYTVPVNFKLQ